MFSFIAKTFKVGICTAALVGLAGVATYAFAGEGRTRTMVHELHGNLMDVIDQNVSDPNAARAQLRKMEQEYPKRIAQVRGDLTELQGEIMSIQREQAISERVVAMAEADISNLETQLASQSVSEAGVQLVARRSVVVNEQLLPLRKAQARLDETRRTRVAYANRAAEASHDLMYLEKQAARLSELLAKLETERAEFQVQIEGLSRDIDAISRNERLIKMLKKRNRTIEECSRYEAVSLDQLTGRLAQLRSHQEAELDLLANEEHVSNYEDLARQQLATEELESKHQLYIEQGSMIQTDF